MDASSDSSVSGAAAVLGADGEHEVAKIFWFSRHTRLVIIFVLISAAINTVRIQIRVDKYVCCVYEVACAYLIRSCARSCFAQP